MESRNGKPPATFVTNSSRTYAQRWRERLTPEEAMRGAKRMMAAYSEFSPCSPEYLMTLAETLCQFPMEVATAACSPVHGVPKEHKNFRPNSGQVSEWCEREAAFLYRMAKREGLLPADSHKTYSGTLKSFNSQDNPKETTAEERCAHVERLRKEGRLTFDTGPEAERRKPWFDRLTKADAERILAEYSAAAAPSVPSPTIEDFDLWGPNVPSNELAPVPF